MYLYCANDPLNRTDITGEMFGMGLWSRLEASSAAFGVKAMALAGRIYAAAYVRAIGVSMFMYGVMYGGGGSGFDPNQRALIELAKQARRTGVTREEAKILMDWAAEYGIPFRNDAGTSHWLMEHIHIWLYHIGLLD